MGFGYPIYHMFSDDLPSILQEYYHVLLHQEVLGLYIAPEIYIHVLIEYEYQSWYEFRYSLVGIEYWDVIS